MKPLFEFLTIVVVGILQLFSVGLVLAFFTFILVAGGSLVITGVIIYVILNLFGVDVRGWIDKHF